jgi:hypothetical protein
LLLPVLAHGDEIDLPLYSTPCVELTDAPVIGLVTAVSGPVSVGSPGCEPAPADCGTALHAGQQLFTGAGASVGVLAGTHYLQVAHDSRVSVGTNDAGGPRVRVEEGSARVMAVGAEPGPPIEVATPTLATGDAGEDVVAAAPPQGAPSICSYADPIEVRDGTRTASVAPGACYGPSVSIAAATPAVSAAPTSGGTASVPLAPPLSIASVARCDVAAGDPGISDVASGPTQLAQRDPLPPPVLPPPYCVGGTCTGDTPKPPPPPPPHVCCPGGIGEQPVIFEPPPD